jgi:hypothetical protein
MKKRIVVSLLLLLSACGESNLPDYSQLGGLRVLAIQSGPAGGAAEVAPAGGAINITVLVSDVTALGRTLTYTTEACIDRGVSFGAKPTCDGAPDRVVVGAGGGTLNTATLAPAFTGEIGPFAVTVPPGLLTGRTDAVRFNGAAYLVIFRIAAPSGEAVTAFKRIVVTERAALNNNPAAPVILANGVALAALPTAAVNLSAVAAGESYSVMNSDTSLTSKTEDPLVTWFFSDGEFQRFRTGSGGANEWTPPASAPAGRDQVFVAVVRDGRGGESWAIQSF